jgi:hypothetical protein
MHPITTYGTITGGVLKISNRNRFLNEISRLKDCAVELSVRLKNKRTNQQSRYLFGCVYKELQIAMNAYGNELSVEDVHEYCKMEFNKIPVVGAGGEVIGYKGGSTAAMNKDEFSVYLDKIFLFAAETLQITIPAPGTELQLF